MACGSVATGEANPQKLFTTANVLGKYFNQLGFDTKKAVINSWLDDRIFIVFRSTGKRNRMFLLQLVSKRVLEPQNSASHIRVDSSLLSYIEDRNNPDVFRISNGDF